MPAYQRKIWIDEAVQYPDRFTMQTLTGGMVNLTPSPGTVDTVGTPQSAVNFNNMEEGIFAANESADFLLLQIMQLQRAVQNVAGERGTVTLNNAQTYPFNSSGATVALKTPRGTVDYFVQVEVASVTGGAVGDVTVSNKLLNGFQISFDGSATQVVINFNVTGGSL